MARLESHESENASNKKRTLEPENWKGEKFFNHWKTQTNLLQLETFMHGESFDAEASADIAFFPGLFPSKLV